MGKLKLEGLTKEQLIQKENQLMQECETLRNVIAATNTSVFDLLIGEVKKEMENNVAEEEWKILKENQKKIESYRSIEKALKNQEDLLEQKQEELEDVQYAIEYYQPSLFEEQAEISKGQSAEYTGYVDENNTEYRVGDIFITENDEYLLIKKSSEIEGKYAVISNFFEEERMLQYPANLELLRDVAYLGNIYDKEHCNEETIAAFKVIAEYHEDLQKSEQPVEENEQSNSAKTESEPETDS